MSADATAWQDDVDGWFWRGEHDLCNHGHEATGLAALLRELEACENDGRPMRWLLVLYTDGTLGLKGYCC